MHQHFKHEFELQKRLFTEDRQDIAEDNMRSLLWASGCGLLVFLILSIITPFLYKGWELSWTYILLLVALCAFTLYAHIINRKKMYELYLARKSCLAFYTCVIMLATLIDTIPYPDGDAVFFPILMVIMPVLFTFHFHVYLILLCWLEGFFILCVRLFKKPDMWCGDIFISLVGFFCALATCWIVLRIRLKQKDQKQILKKLSTTDLLTGVLNKVTCETSARKALERKCVAQQAIIIIDLDNFKQINDTYGHHVGDMALVEFAELLKNIFNQNSILGRVGGDEFLIMIPAVHDPNTIEGLCKQINTQVAKLPLQNDQMCSCSIGAVVCENGSSDFRILCDEADTNLYKVKQAGKNSYCISHIQKTV